MEHATKLPATTLPVRPVRWWQSLALRVGVLLTIVISILTVTISIASARAYEAGAWSQLLWVWLLAVLAAAAVSFLLGRYLTGPLYQLTRAMQAFLHGREAAVILTSRTDELGNLIRFYNAMTTWVRATHRRDEHVSQLKTRFVSVAAHQLRTPLTGMKWALQQLLEPKLGELSPARRKIIEQQQQINDHLIRLINQLLNVARIEEGKFVTDFKELDAIALIKEVVEEYGMQAQAKQIQLVFVNRAGPAMPLIADKEHLMQVISNLIDNAIRYSSAGSTVQVTATLMPASLQIRVRDEGIGIPAEDQEQIFSRFYRAPNAMKMQTDGNGLGLYIARKVVERHGGTLTFTSRAEHGTSFVITLPLPKGGTA